MVYETVVMIVGDFVDWSLGIVSIMILWYIVKFFLVGPAISGGNKEGDTEWAEKGAGMRDWWKKKKSDDEEKDKITKAAEKRRRLLEPAKGFLIRVEQIAERLREEEFATKSTAAVTSAKNQADALERNLKSAQRVLRVARLHEKGERREYFLKLYDYAAIALEHNTNEIKKKMPAPASRNWDSAVCSIRHQAQFIRGLCGALIDSIDKYIDEDKVELAGLPG
ncbi:MAG: hypothetical protein AABW48_04430, partial [Nanoarchaeota archaeon]